MLDIPNKNIKRGDVKTEKKKEVSFSIRSKQEIMILKSNI